MWNERNARAFEGRGGKMSKVRDIWLHKFGLVILDHDIYREKDFGNVTDILIDL